MQGTPTKSERPAAAVWLAFAITRLAIFFAATSATDYQVYYQYGAVARNASVAALFREHDAEYPQLAVAFSAGVGWVADQLPDGAERLIAARPSKPPNVGAARFQVALGLVLFAIDLGVLLLIAQFARRSDPADGQTQTWRLGVYVAASAAIGPVLYDRLDLVVGAVALLAVLTLASGRSILAYALLTACAAFKLVPALLLPVFVLAAAVRRGGRFWPSFAREVGVSLLVFSTWPILAVLFGGGDRAFVYVEYHSARGPELGSAYAFPLFLSADVGVGYAFGGYELRGPAADAAAMISGPVALVAVGLAVLIAGRALRRVSAFERDTVVVGGCVLVWLVFILSNKVGSPQYLLWLAPLVSLLPLRTTSDRRWAVGFVGAAVLASLMYPYLWKTVHGEPLPDQPGAWAGPTPLGLALLAARWVVLTVLTLWLMVRLWNTVRTPATPTSPAP